MSKTMTSEENIKSIEACQKSLHDTCDLFTIAFSKKQHEAFLDAVLSIEAHAEYCVQHKQYYAINIATNSIHSILHDNRKAFREMIEKSPVRQEIIAMLSASLGTHRLISLLKLEHNNSRHQGLYSNQDLYKLSIADECTIYKGKLIEFLRSGVESNYYSINLSGPAEWGEHLSIAEAIHFFSKVEDGKQHLAKIKLWKSLSEYSPSKKTKTNYLKLPDSIKKAMVANEDLMCESYLAENLGHAPYYCSNWVARELIEFGLKKIGTLILQSNFGIDKTPEIAMSLYRVVKIEDGERSYRGLSLLREQGYASMAEAMAEPFTSLLSKGNFSATHKKLSAIAYYFELPSIDNEWFEHTLGRTIEQMITDNPLEDSKQVADFIIEMQRAHEKPDREKEFLCDRLYALHKAIGRFIAGSATERNPIAEHLTVTRLGDKAKDILSIIEKTLSYKRGMISADMGL